MKILILSTSSTTGGAAIATVRLADALTRRGQDVTLMTIDGSGKIPFIRERLGIFLSNGLSRRNLFKVSTASAGVPLHNHPDVREADVILLGWFNQGLLSLKEMALLNKPLIWTMHDLWAFTGICHHPLGCKGFHRQCGDCPFIRRPLRRPNDLSHRVWKKKSQLYPSLSIKFVAVSNWLLKQAKQSSLIGDRAIAMIPNPHPIDDYTPVKGTEQLIVMGAARLDDPIKGLPNAIAALNAVHDEMPEAKAAFFGSIRRPAILKQLRMPYTLEGTLAADDLKRLYERASVVLSASDFETSGNTLIEGMASGAVPVSFDQGGQTDIIRHLTDGYLARHPDVEDLARGIRWALKADIDPMVLHIAAKAKFDDNAIASQYLKLISEI